ncbi:hypothetical protein RB195_016548 [Necator americanus]|uniref:Apple domain-containing protein n=1 Tax=Necator americanus TaxID=51031 RepID=A0ABR1C0Z8_NECAM
MIIRLLLYLLPMNFISASLDDRDCAIRVDILDGADLVEGVATFLTEKTIAASAMRCAMECYRKKCDVAYFHRATHECRYTPESASTTIKLPCNDVIAVEHKEGVDVLDKVKRFCMRCKGFKVSGSQKHFSDDNSLEQVHLNTIETKPIPMRIVRPATPRVRLFLPPPLAVAIPPRPKTTVPQSIDRNQNKRVKTPPTRIFTPPPGPYRRKLYNSIELQRIDTVEKRPTDLRPLVRFPTATTLRPIRIRPRLPRPRPRKVDGYSFRKELYKIALLPSHPQRTRFFKGASTDTQLRFSRKKKRGWGRA